MTLKTLITLPEQYQKSDSDADEKRLAKRIGKNFSPTY